MPMDGSYGDPVGDLVRAAVADRPLEDVVHLIALLEESPHYAPAMGAALRAVGVDRSVEDVTRLVALPTRPPRDADSAGEAIRAAESRPVEEVTRLVALLNRSEPQTLQPLRSGGGARGGDRPARGGRPRRAPAWPVRTAAVLMIWPTLPVLVLAVVVPTGVAAGQLLDGRFRSQGLAGPWSCRSRRPGSRGRWPRVRRRPR
ncbi:hypothetical protein [Streptomyces canus]|uniref:hypothetical protein n=1 Tax=Streptomyces canus TaxID=58343 RepID=UPI0027882BDF|nr:hypothetical protein [Streptomyces canus]MDQ0766432.1 hypothetical protein [Streptomyces canus]